jgi:hypothetical protein
MRLIGAASIVFVSAVGLAASGHEHQVQNKDGQAIFRYDTFGDEQFWTDVLRMHEVIPTVPPETALAGLKVDADALPADVVAGVRSGDIADGSGGHGRVVTPECRRRREGNVQRLGRLTRVGVTCALCHSSVDDSFARHWQSGSTAGPIRT